MSFRPACVTAKRPRKAEQPPGETGTGAHHGPRPRTGGARQWWAGRNLVAVHGRATGGTFEPLLFGVLARDHACELRASRAEWIALGAGFTEPKPGGCSVGDDGGAIKANDLSRAECRRHPGAPGRPWRVDAIKTRGRYYPRKSLVVYAVFRSENPPGGHLSGLSGQLSVRFRGPLRPTFRDWQARWQCAGIIVLSSV